MKKKILFVINSLTIGGSEKSLVSLLSTMNYDKYDVDIMMFKKGGEFDKYVPKQVKILDLPMYYKFINKDILDLPYKNKIKYYLCRLSVSIGLRLKKGFQEEQILYKYQSKVLNNIEKVYDIAVAYSQGLPTYFVADKVKAKNKIAWINCDYETTAYNKDVDEIYYSKYTSIVVVSDTIKKSIINIKPQYENKIHVILDIVNPDLIYKMADEETVFKDKSYINILTVARLVIPYKGYDTAIKSAIKLKDAGIKFKWFVIGDGPDRKNIRSLIEANNLEDSFILLGPKENPYPYMKNCDIYVQPSKKEGFGLTVMEAKILKKPIVCTNFNTAKELIDNEIDGLIVENNSEDLYKGIIKYINNDEFKQNIIKHLLNCEPYKSTSEIHKIDKLFI